MASYQTAPRGAALTNIDQVLENLQLSTSLPHLSCKELLSQLPTDADIQQQHTLKNIQKYACMTLLGFVGFGGWMSDGFAWGPSSREDEGAYHSSCRASFGSPVVDVLAAAFIAYHIFR